MQITILQVSVAKEFTNFKNCTNYNLQVNIIKETENFKKCTKYNLQVSTAKEAKNFLKLIVQITICKLTLSKKLKIFFKCLALPKKPTIFKNCTNYNFAS